MRTLGGIPESEFAERRANALALAKERGLAGLLVCARGGGTMDRYGDVKYLTNFYTPFPYIPDLAEEWTARAHAFLVLPVSDAPLLVIDVPDDGSIALDPDCLCYSDLVLEKTVAAFGMGSSLRK